MTTRRQTQFLPLYILLTLVALVLGLERTQALAQTPFLKQTGSITPEIILKPAFPSPGEEVVATLALTGKVGANYVTWTVDGEVVQQSSNSTSYKFTAGAAGTRTTISATASDTGRGTISATKEVIINNIVMLWEGSTYTPPLFRGRALVTPGAEATVVVLPTIYNASGGVLDSASLNYIWRVNANVTPLASGRGVTTITVANDKVFKPIRVSVSIENAQGVVVGNKYVDIPLVQPEVLLYEDSKLLGARMSRALRGTYTLANSEVTLIAEPYYISAESRTDDNLSYMWQIGQLTQDNAGTIVLRPEGSGAGKGDLQVTITNKKYLAQRIRGDLSILFSLNGSRDGVETTNTTPL